MIGIMTRNYYSEIIYIFKFNVQVQFNPRNEHEILVTPMRHAAVVVTLASPSLSTTDGVVKNNVKDKDASDKNENKEGNKESNSATHNLVPLEDEVQTFYDTSINILTPKSQILAHVK